MPMKNPERALATLTGEVHALYMAMQVIARTHPNPAHALAEFEKAQQLGLVGLEPHPVPEAAIDGFRDAAKAIRQAFQANPRYNGSSQA